ncbi:MAG: 2Fe-2S iron-sulfur cluster-binding protein [Candidatus Puniceispirillaceae bacterium]
MTGFRLSKGGLIDRNKPLQFTFDGQIIDGYEGDVATSALLASGKRVFGRGFKYHRPRGVMSAGAEEGGALFQMYDGPGRIANVKGPLIEIHQDLPLSGQNGFPSVRFDMMAVNGLFKPFLTAGFYYKTFMGPLSNTKFWMFCERFIRKAAGMGAASREPDCDSYDIANGFCDLLVVGAGPAGLRAAVAAAESGKSVWLVEQDFKAGGWYLSSGEADKLDWVQMMVNRFLAAGGVMKLRTGAFGLYDGTVAGLVEHVTDHLSEKPENTPREIFHILHAEAIILATGATERGIAFGDNDRPGVMNASAIQTYINRYGVAPGKRILFSGTHDGIYENALCAAKAGLHVTVLDSREQISSELVRLCTAHDIALMKGTVPVKAIGRSGVVGLEYARKAQDDIISEGKVIACDVIGVSGGFSANIQLVSHRGVKPYWDDSILSFLSGETVEPIALCGAADGAFEDDYIASSVIRALSLAGVSTQDATSSGESRQAGWQNGIDSLFEVRIKGKKLKSFIDPQHDVTTADIRQAKAEGFVSVEHMKRYTTLGMATDQGRNGNVLGIAAMAEARQLAITDVGITTFRPPYTPVSIGVLAGRSVGHHWQPVRRTPMHNAHKEQGAPMTDAGLWHRAWYYPQDGETITQAYIREAARVRQTVGIVDVSTLGKIAIQGPDAAEFVNRLYINGFAKLPVGRARYGIMLRDDGMVLDDGTTWRLADDDFFMTTTTAQAGEVMRFLEELRQTRWSDLKVHLTSVTDQWGAVAIAGPQARALLQKAMAEIDFSDEAFGFMDVKTATLKVDGRQVSVRAARISFSGERAYEVYIEAAYAKSFWQKLVSFLDEFDGVCYGLEALGALRIEKGHVTGAELEGRVTLEDAGFAAMASSKKDYVGNVLRRRPALQNHQERQQLVGIMPVDNNQTFGAGAILCAPDNLAGFGDGWISAVTHSPALGHWIGLGFAKGGYKQWEGTHLIAADPVNMRQVAVKLVSPHMFDPKGERMHG